MMIGRGGLARPDLARLVQSNLNVGADPLPALEWAEVAAMVEQFFHQSDSRSEKYAGNRTKQWLGYLRQTYTGAELMFHQIKKLRSIASISAAIADQRRHADRTPVKMSHPPARRKIKAVG